MHMLHVRDLLAQVFVSKGYAVEEGPLGGLIARSPAETLLVEWKADAPATSEDVRALAAVLPRCGAERAVLVAAAGASPGVVHEATHRKVDTWSLSRAALEVGLAALEAAEDGARAGTPAPAAPVPAPAPQAPPSPAPPKSLLATAASAATNSHAAMLLPSKATHPSLRESAPAARVLPSPWDIAAGSASVPRQGYEEKSRGPAKAGTKTVVARDGRDAELVGGSKVKKAPSAAPVPNLPPNAALRVRLTEADAAARASSVGPVQSAKLLLVPHVAFDFDCKVEHEALPAPIVAKGTVLANAATGLLAELPILEFAESPRDAERIPARLQAVDVYDKVKSHLLRATTKEVKVEKDVGGVTVMGTERVGPSLDELGIVHRGVVHVPVWRVVGAHGSADVDAVTGAVAAK